MRWLANEAPAERRTASAASHGFHQARSLFREARLNKDKGCSHVADVAGSGSSLLRARDV
jgi:hypothetical protein